MAQDVFGAEQNIETPTTRVVTGDKNVSLPSIGGALVEGMGGLTSRLEAMSKDIRKQQLSSNLGADLGMAREKLAVIDNPAERNVRMEGMRSFLLSKYGADSYHIIKSGLEPNQDTTRVIDRGGGDLVEVVTQANGEIKSTRSLNVTADGEVDKINLSNVGNFIAHFPAVGAIADKIFMDNDITSNMNSSHVLDFINPAVEASRKIEATALSVGVYVKNASRWGGSLDAIKDRKEIGRQEITTAFYNAMNSLLNENILDLARHAKNLPPEQLSALPRAMTTDLLRTMSQSNVFAQLGINFTEFQTQAFAHAKAITEAYDAAAKGDTFRLEEAAKTAKLRVEMFKDNTMLEVIRNDPETAKLMSMSDNLSKMMSLSLIELQIGAMNRGDQLPSGPRDTMKIVKNTMALLNPGSKARLAEDLFETSTSIDLNSIPGLKNLKDNIRQLEFYGYAPATLKMIDYVNTHRGRIKKTLEEGGYDPTTFFKGFDAFSKLFQKQVKANNMTEEEVKTTGDMMSRVRKSIESGYRSLRNPNATRTVPKPANP